MGYKILVALAIALFVGAMAALLHVGGLFMRAQSIHDTHMINGTLEE